jgi:outer membrane protein assembly factor BamD (BamD/ComL family)
MADTQGRSPILTQLLYGLLTVAGIVMVAMYWRSGGTMRDVVLVVGVILVVVPAAAYPIALAVLRQGRAGGVASTSDASAESIQLLRSINDRMLLSDTARRLSGRSKDREALRQAIREDLIRGDYDAALVLVDEIGHTHGFREEAEEFREQIIRARAADYEQKVDKSIASLQDILSRGDFERAISEAAKIQRLYPDSPKARDLTRRVREAREQHKHQLERELYAAYERDDTTRSMALLKELDKYLSEQEAAPLMELARGVISKQLKQYGMAFKIAVQDKDWVSAVQVGEQIVREFPNSKMSEEVRSRLDTLRQNAAQQQAARGAHPAAMA